MHLEGALLGGLLLSNWSVYGRSFYYTFLLPKLGAGHGLTFTLSALTKGPVLMFIPLVSGFWSGGGIFLRGLSLTGIALNTL